MSFCNPKNFLHMKKIFYFSLLLLFITNTVISQNYDNSNKGNQINLPDAVQNNDIPNQQIVMNNLPQIAYPQQAAIPQ